MKIRTGKVEIGIAVTNNRTFHSSVVNCHMGKCLLYGLSGQGLKDAVVLSLHVTYHMSSSATLIPSLRPSPPFFLQNCNLFQERRSFPVRHGVHLRNNGTQSFSTSVSRQVAAGADKDLRRDVNIFRVSRQGAGAVVLSQLSP